MTPHRPLQLWMTEQGKKIPELHAQREARARVMAREQEPIADRKTLRPANANVESVRRRAVAAGARLVGIARTDPEWIYEGYAFDYPWIILFGIEMDYGKLQTAPEIPAAITVVTAYTNGWIVAQAVSNEIRSLGWRAEPHGGPQAGPVNLIPAALASGFGELGKHGSIINGELGSNFRLAAVFTDLPLIADTPRDIAAEGFCTNCQVCVNACPVDAISNDKQQVRGSHKWYVDFDRCVPYFNEHAGCAICIAVCPWSAPGRAPRLTAKMLRHRTKTGGDGL